jgi:chromate reductase
MLLHAAVDLEPDRLVITSFDIGRVPLYNADLDDDEQRPEGAAALKHAVAESDGLLIASPEYNHSVPGVLQNAIDWASRPGLKSPLRRKPVAIMGASRGLIGTARAQQVLKLTLMSTLALVMPHPGVAVGQASEKFADGALAHEPTRAFLTAFLDDFVAWLDRTAG